MPQNNLGRVAFKFKGDYSQGETYTKYDVVFDGESSYVSLIDANTGNLLTDVTKWEYLAKGNALLSEQNALDIAQTRADLNKVETNLNVEIDNLTPKGWYNTLTISDEQGNVLIDVESGIRIDENGNIETNAIEQENKFDSHLQVSDEYNNAILDLRSGIKVDEYGDIMTNSFDSTRVINYSKFGSGGVDLIFNKKAMQMPIEMMKRKIVDKTNRFVVSFNGDSIIGSQLEDITHSAEYDSGAYPPNMSKNIMARKFYDKYKFEGEDTVFRNLEHSDWIKNGFNVTKGKGDKSKESNFNEFELWGCASANDSVQISVTDKDYFKLIWSRASNANLWTCSLTISVDGGLFLKPSELGIKLPDVFGKEDTNHREMQVYRICRIDKNKNYVFKIAPTLNYQNVTIWGCEFWNYPRLDVVVEAFSGTTAKTQVAIMQDAYCSEWHKPMLMISDVLAINDESYINNSDDTLDIWMKSNATLYNICKDNGIPLLLIAPNQVTGKLTYAAPGLAVSNNIPVIDIIKLLVEDGKNSQYVVNLSDGVHLSDIGNTYYFSKIEQIFN